MPTSESQNHDLRETSSSPLGIPDPSNKLIATFKYITKDASVSTKILVGMFLLLILLAFPIVIALLTFSASPIYPTAVFIAIVIFAFFLVIILLPIIKQSIATDQSGQEIWSDEFPRFEDTSSQGIHEQLDTIRDIALRYFSDNFKDRNVQLNDIRSNIYLPNYIRPQIGHAFFLISPVSYRSGSYKEREYSVTFNPGDGHTGETFRSGRRKIGTEMHYRLTTGQKEIMHDGLQWWICFPLKDLKNEHLKLGVCNISGLKHPFTEKELIPLAEKIEEETDNLKVFRENLSEKEKVRISVNLKMLGTQGEEEES